jgi:hypothetical protein
MPAPSLAASICTNRTFSVSSGIRANVGQWNLLGTYPFAPGTFGTVTILSCGTNGYVVAGAIKLEWAP